MWEEVAGQDIKLAAKWKHEADTHLCEALIREHRLLRSVTIEFSADLLIRAYRNGYFPMAEPEEEAAIYWHAPDPRALMPIWDTDFSSNLLRRVRRRPFRVTTDRAFREVMVACADRPTTWISDRMIEAYTELHRRGHAHSVECWQEDALAGGLYGVQVGGAFFGESMFYRVSNASKIALVHLTAMLREAEFDLHDIQYLNDHTERFGGHEIRKREFIRRLMTTRDRTVEWPAPPDMPDLAEL